MACSPDINMPVCPQPHAWTIQTVRWFSTSCSVPLIASISSTPASQVQQRLSFREFKNIYLLCVYVWYVAIVILQGSNLFIFCHYLYPFSCASLSGVYNYQVEEDISKLKVSVNSLLQEYNLNVNIKDDYIHEL